MFGISYEHCSHENRELKDVCSFQTFGTLKYAEKFKVSGAGFLEDSGWTIFLEFSVY